MDVVLLTSCVEMHIELVLATQRVTDVKTKLLFAPVCLQGCSQVLSEAGKNCFIIKVVFAFAG